MFAAVVTWGQRSPSTSLTQHVKEQSEAILGSDHKPLRTENETSAS